MNQSLDESMNERLVSLLIAASYLPQQQLTSTSTYRQAPVEDTADAANAVLEIVARTITPAMGSKR